jgi:MFS transporter, OPA family, glycerol-3-phosphate transporter
MVDALPRRLDPAVRARARTLFVLWVTYGSLYFCRVNVGPAVASIRHDLGFTALEIGLVLGSIKLGYALVQLVNGQLTERFGARRILGIGMVGSAVATLLFAAAPWIAGVPVLGTAAAGIASAVSSAAHAVGIEETATTTLGVMMTLAFCNGWFQAGGWPPVVKVAAAWFPLEHRGRTMGVLGTSLTLGSALAIFAVGALLRVSGDAWRVAFIVPAVMLLVSFVHTMLRLRERPEAATDGGMAAPPERLSLRDALVATLGNRRLWVLALGLFGLDAVRYGFLDWAPGHLAEVHHTGSLAAALKTAVFPLAGAAGAFTSGWITDRFFQSRRAPVCAIFLGAVGVLTLAYRVLVHAGTAPTVLCLGLVGFALYGAQILLVGTAAQDFARRGATAAAAGFVDFTGHMGAFSGDVVTGWMLRRHGWGGAIAWWAFAALAAGALVATLWRAKPNEALTG